jgi:prepilin peptidase CpaA
MLEPLDALILFPLVLPIALWAAFWDLKYMKIPNLAVLAALAVFVVGGAVLLPFQTYLWALAYFGIALVMGFVLSTLWLVGAGDAKFAAAITPYFIGADPLEVMLLVAICLLITFTLHRIIRGIGPIRRATPDWVSWTHRQFPMALGMSAVLLIYLGNLALDHFSA